MASSAKSRPSRLGRAFDLLPRPTLFWRTFALIALLLTLSFAFWYQLQRSVLVPTPVSSRAQLLSGEMHVFTRLLASASSPVSHLSGHGAGHGGPGMHGGSGDAKPESMDIDAGALALLGRLITSTGYSLHFTPVQARVEHWPKDSAGGRLELQLEADVAADLRTARRVDGVDGLWIRLSERAVDTEAGPMQIWLRTGTNRLVDDPPPEWLNALAITLLLSLFGALGISRLVNAPLAELAQSIDSLARGDDPEPLPVRGPTEISDLNHRFNQLSAELRSSDAERALVLAGISHDIRTPLTRLRLEIEMSALDQGARESIADEIERIDSIVAQFIQFAQHEDGRIERIDVSGEILKALRPWELPEADPTVRIDADLERPLYWNGNVTTIHRTLTNLIDNACKYGRDAQGFVHIEIRTQRRGRMVELMLRDHGPGVPSQALPVLARPFARVDPERGASGGTGLGLAVVARLARRCGGSLELGNAPDGGFVTVVRLGDHRPRAESAAAA